MRELKIGICGCGRMGRERARCLAALGASVQVVFDSDAERATALAHQCGAKAAPIDTECLQRLDAIFVCVPPGCRGGIERQCARSRIALFVEKPVGVSAARASESAQLIELSGMINAVGYMNRYRASVQAARGSLQRSKVIGFSAHWIGKRYGVPWWSVDELSGGPFNEQATHLFDLSRFLFGDVTGVHSQAHGDSRVSTTFRFASGVLGTAFYSCEAMAKDIGFRIFAEQGSLALTGWDFALTENTIDSTTVLLDKEDIFLEETRAFLTAVRESNQAHVLCSFAEAMKTQLVMDTARQTMLTPAGQALWIPDQVSAHV
jgi:myo-inositol 2-dehydrogenase / D-chiro-inositol 1-dehydrogenase